MSVPYQVYDLKQQRAGATVVVTLKGNAANVRLMTSSAFSAYKAGRNFRAIQGLVKKSPVRLRIPNGGHWYLVVDLVGLGGRVSSSAHVEPPPLPALRSAPAAPLSMIRHAPPAVGSATESVQQVWDVFISHASEDKETVAAPLAQHLQDLGVTVWLDSLELKIGDSLRRKIDEGLANSRFGVVVFSRPFLAKGWTQYELDGLVTRQVDGEQNLLPIWHDITRDEIKAASPSLVEKFALLTAQFGIEDIARQIADVVKEQNEDSLADF
ncbi:TIR domain-containing protein [Klenkia marina]|uniref:TIR domain-containing protein n=1 Tax=Klenkia marina TaxID=1960309 RepID=A0A1G4Z281_9ACTN|nr:TIR domain-containing protein [Klenkia marina]